MVLTAEIKNKDNMYTYMFSIFFNHRQSCPEEYSYAM
jgi:hypothetical protein